MITTLLLILPMVFGINYQNNASGVCNSLSYPSAEYGAQKNVSVENCAEACSTGVQVVVATGFSVYNGDDVLIPGCLCCTDLSAVTFVNDAVTYSFTSPTSANTNNVDNCEPSWEDEVEGDNKQCNDGVYAGKFPTVDGCKEVCVNDINCVGIHYASGWGSCFTSNECSSITTSVSPRFHVYLITRNSCEEEVILNYELHRAGRRCEWGSKTDIISNAYLTEEFFTNAATSQESCAQACVNYIGFDFDGSTNECHCCGHLCQTSPHDNRNTYIFTNPQVSATDSSCPIEPEVEACFPEDQIWENYTCPHNVSWGGFIILDNVTLEQCQNYCLENSDSCTAISFNVNNGECKISPICGGPNSHNWEFVADNNFTVYKVGECPITEETESITEEPFCQSESYNGFCSGPGPVLVISAPTVVECENFCHDFDYVTHHCFAFSYHVETDVCILYNSDCDNLVTNDDWITKTECNEDNISAPITQD